MASGTIPSNYHSTGTPTYVADYFNAPVYNFYERFGNVVHFHFHAQIKAEIPNNVAVVSNLPRPINDFRFTPEICDDQYGTGAIFPRGASFANGSVAQFAIASTYVGKYMLYDLVYLTKD